MYMKVEDDSYYAVVDHCFLAIQGENNTRTVSILHPSVTDAESYYLRVQIADDMIYDLAIVHQKVVLPSSVTVRAGEVAIQWIAKGKNGSVIAKSQIIQAVVKPAIDGDISALPTPEEIKNTYDTYVDTMTDIKEQVVKVGEQVKENAEKADHIIENAEVLLEKLGDYVMGSYLSVYVDTQNGSDDNDGKSPDTAFKTLDQALKMTTAYQKVVIALKSGQTFSATTTSNEYGTGVMLHACSVAIEAYGDNAQKPIWNQSIYVFDGQIRIDHVDVSMLYAEGAVVDVEYCNTNTLNCKTSLIQTANSVMKTCINIGGYLSLYQVRISSALYIYNSGIVNMDESTFINGYVLHGNTLGCILCDGVPTGLKAKIKESIDNGDDLLQQQITEMQSVKNVYVNAESGSDSNTGSSTSKAFATLAKALEVTQPMKKAIIYLAAGTYDIPDASVTWIGRDIRIYGNTATDTTVNGSIIVENGYAVLSRITLHSNEKNAITGQYNANIRIVDSEIVSASDYCLFLNYDAKAICSAVLFSAAEKRAIQISGSSNISIYNCTDDTGKGVRSANNCMAYLNNCNQFSYANDTYGMVYVNGQQVAPQTASTAAILSMGGNI